VKLPNKLII